MHWSSAASVQTLSLIKEVFHQLLQKHGERDVIIERSHFSLLSPLLLQIVGNVYAQDKFTYQFNTCDKRFRQFLATYKKCNHFLRYDQTYQRISFTLKQSTQKLKLPASNNTSQICNFFIWHKMIYKCRKQSTNQLMKSAFKHARHLFTIRTDHSPICSCITYIINTLHIIQLHLLIFLR